MNNTISTFRLDGRRALVTGSTRGIGLAIADILAAHGAEVIRHNSAIADLSSTEQTARFIAEIAAVDILVLNASVQYYQSVESFDQKEYQHQLDVNIRSSLQLIEGFLPGMRERSWGRVLAIGSVNQWKPSPRLPIYAATKAALSNIIQNCARQYSAEGVTFNNLAPGVITTDRNREALADPNLAARLLESIPADRFGTPADCAGAALLLCSDAGSYITGVDLPVTGGMHL